MNDCFDKESAHACVFKLIKYRMRQRGDQTWKENKKDVLRAIQKKG